MSTRQIEDCFSLEILEEEEYTRFISICAEDVFIWVIDPYMIDLGDLRRAKKPGAIIRARRPAWGKGDLHKYIYPIRRKE